MRYRSDAASDQARYAKAHIRVYVGALIDALLAPTPTRITTMRIRHVFGTILGMFSRGKSGCIG